MASDKTSNTPNQTAKTQEEAEARRQRSADELRRNLGKRKQQARDRDAAPQQTPDPQKDRP